MNWRLASWGPISLPLPGHHRCDLGGWSGEEVPPEVGKGELGGAADVAGGDGGEAVVGQVEERERLLHLLQGPALQGADAVGAQAEVGEVGDAGEDALADAPDLVPRQVQGGEAGGVEGGNGPEGVVGQAEGAQKGAL